MLEQLLMAIAPEHTESDEVVKASRVLWSGVHGTNPVEC